MSAQYDLYETPDPDCTGEQKPLHARIVPNGTYSKKRIHGTCISFFPDF